MDYPALLWLSFIAGIYAPLGSPCVIILYPGYLAFLAGTDEENRASPFLLGLTVACGVLISLLPGGPCSASPCRHSALQPGPCSSRQCRFFSSSFHWS